MKAAVVSDFHQPPQFTDFEEPADAEGLVRVRMLAAGVHHLVRSIASGAHYSSGEELPFVPGVDGVADLNGRRVYTGGCPDPFGTLAEWAPVPAGWTVPVPDSLSTELAAAVVNPALSSWLPLASAQLPPGATVLVLGATGAAGSLATRIAFHLGAARVVAAGRDPEILGRLAEDDRITTVSLAGSAEDVRSALAAALADGVDVVLDYLWGPVAQVTLEALRSRSPVHGGSAVRYVQIGAIAGRTLELDAAILRARRITISGSGAGSIDPGLLFAELPKMLALAAAGGLDLATRVAPLSDVASAWNAAGSGRLVLAMG